MGTKKGDRKSVNHTTGVNVVSRLKQNIEEFPSIRLRASKCASK